MVSFGLGPLLLDEPYNSLLTQLDRELSQNLVERTGLVKVTGRRLRRIWRFRATLTLTHRQAASRIRI
jgi:hypothetical protein